MWFWIFMFFSNMLVPLVMIGAGRMMWKQCPGRINRVYGYRTKRSMKNMDTWKFAHEYCGKLWYKWGKIVLIVTMIAMLFLLGKSVDTIGNWGGVICMLQLVPLVGVIGPTERALRKTFDKKGNRRKIEM